MRRLDLNTKKFWILREKIAKFWKIRIFKQNSALSYSTLKKFPMRVLDLNAKKITFGDFEFLKFNEENR